jgi:hypothetical protein
LQELPQNSPSVINDLDTSRTRGPCRPLEADPRLIIDANAVLPFSVTLQGFEPVARQSAQILKLYRRFQAIQLDSGGALKSRERFDRLTGCDISGPFVPVADDHISGISDRYVLR